MIKEYIRKDLRNYKPYHVDMVQYKAKLDANESPYNLDINVKKDIIRVLNEEENYNIYPDTDSLKLRNILADFWNVNAENIICGVGSDQLIDCILKLFLEPNDKVIMPNPSFSMYKLTTLLNHGVPIEFSLNDDYSYDIDKVIKLCSKEKPKVVFICSPNNPTGNSIKNTEIIKLLEKVSCPIIVDEAYGEFSEETMIKYVKEYKNLIVLRTFSKAYGLAGLRVGYGIANKDMIDAVNITKPPYNLNTFSQLVAVEVLKRSSVYKDRIDKIIKEKNWLYKELEKIEEIKCYKSDANFILVKTKWDNLGQKLREKGILVRSFSKEAKLENCTRITVGNRKQNELLLKVLKLEI